MKTVQDLIEACNRGEKPILKVTGLVCDEFELEAGSFLRVTGYEKIRNDCHTVNDCHAFTYNFDEFIEYNRKLLKRNWVLKNGIMGTAEEFGAWEMKNTVLYFDGDVSDPLYKYDLEHYTGSAREVLLTEIARLEKELSEYREKLAHLETENKVGGNNMNSARKYRKKPVVVEAIQVSWRNWNALGDFMPGVISEQNPARKSLSYSETCGEPGPEYIEFSIPTLEGVMLAKHGDYIVKGVNGEFYPVKPDIFEKTYEGVAE